jgi:hypothetical protein
MAIRQIKINGTAHDIQTTIANVDDLQATLDNKADAIQTKSGSVIVAENCAHTPVKGLKLYGKTT